MVDVEALNALDLLIWLGRGADAAQRLGCNQTTVSRRSRQCLDLFGLPVLRNHEGRCRIDRHPLLTQVREVHQLHRLRQGSGLRIEASLLAAPLLRSPIPSGWISGHLDGLGRQRPLQMLEERILDAWVTGMGQELPERGLESMHCIPLLQTPLLLAAEPQHPLHHQGHLRIGDLEGVPRLAPRQGLYPRTEQALGSWRCRTAPLPLECPPRRQGQMSSRRKASPRLAPLRYGTAFSLAHQTSLQALPLSLGVQAELTVVMRRDVADSPPMEALIEALQHRALEAALADQGVIAVNG